MKSLVIIIILLVPCLINGQTPGEWTWMNGSSINGNPVYGTQGVPAPGNTPGTCYEGRAWVDLNGNFWLYGGTTNGMVTNDLWRFNPTTNEWAWMKGSANPVMFSQSSTIAGAQGVPHPANNPATTGTGQSASWLDQSGDLWLLVWEDVFVGMGTLWRYEMASNMWVWEHGNIPANYGIQGVPSALNFPGLMAESPVTWVDDQGDLWLFDAYNSGVMWKYNIASNMWTWMSGAVGGAAVYGAQGIADADNQPGGGMAYTHWKRDDGTFYLYFGCTQFITPGMTWENIMWKFDPTVNQWAWVAGSTTANLPSTFSDQCTFSVDNLPGNSIEQTACWKDECDHFFAYHATEGYLWCFDPVLNQFALIDGDLTPSNPVFGTQGVSAPNVDPGLPFGCPSWVDQNGDLWMLGSIDYTTLIGTGAMMRYVLDPTCIATGGAMNVSINASPTEGCVPLDVSFTPSLASSTITYYWDFGVPGTESDTSNLVQPVYTYTSTGTYTVQLIVEGEFCGSLDSDTLSTTIVVADLPVVFVNDTTICSEQTAMLQASGADSYSWSPVAGLSASTGANVQANPTQTINYIVTGTVNGCSSVDTATVTVLSLPEIDVNDATICLDESATLTVSGADEYVWSPAASLNISTGPTVIATPISTTVYTVTGTNITSQCSNTAEVTVTVDIPVVTVNSGAVCGNDPNDQLILTASGADSYNWSPALGLNTTAGAEVAANPEQTTIYTVVGTTTNNCIDTAYSTVTVVPDFSITVNSDSICSGETVLLIASGADTYNWTPSNGLNQVTGSEVLATPMQTTVYNVTGNSQGCEETAQATVVVLPLPEAVIFANPNPATIAEPIITFSTLGGQSAQSWYLEDALLSELESFSHTFPGEPGEFSVQLIVENELGCADTAFLTVVINEEIIFYVPNSFTPDGDNKNPLFVPVISTGIDMESGYLLQIFDRWGEEIFVSNQIGEGWDGMYGGNRCPDGTYTWKLTFKSKYDNGRFEHNGHVVLIR